MSGLLRAGAAALAIAAAGPAAGQTLHEALGAPDALKVSASVRVRYEALDGQFRPGFRAAEDLISVRTTVFAEYDTGPLRIGGEIYDSRVADADRGSVIGTGEVNLLEPVQAYVAADFAAPFGKGSAASLQLGRFTLNLGSRRLVAADDYRNTTNGYTGVRADLKARDGTSATLIYVLPQTRLPDTLPDLLDHRVELDRESFDTQLWGALLQKPRAFGRTMAELGYFGLFERDAPGRPTRDRHLHNVSARILREPEAGRIDYEVEGIYQFGSVRTSAAPLAPETDVAAGFLHADLGYSFRDGWKPRLSVEFDRASGDRPGGSYNRFDTLYGMRRADLAPAGIYAALGRTNISTIGLRAEARPDRNTDAFLVGRALWAASPTDAFATTGVRDATGASGSFAGYQLEGRVRRWIVPDLLRAEANGAWLVKRGLLRDAPNAPRAGDTLYLSLALTLSL